MSTTERRSRAKETGRPTQPAVLMGAGAALGTSVATMCCVPLISPFLVATFGVSGAVWLAGLKPYALYLLGGGALSLTYAFWVLYRPGNGNAQCPPARRRFRMGSHRATTFLIWLVAAVWVFSAGSFVLLNWL